MGQQGGVLNVLLQCVCWKQAMNHTRNNNNNNNNNNKNNKGEAHQRIH